MKPLVFALAVSLALAGATSAQQKPQNRSLDGTPLDPFKEGARIRAKELAQKNYEEMRQAAVELVDLSQKLNLDVAEGGENVISARIFDRLDKIEKLTKRIRDKAKGATY